MSNMPNNSDFAYAIARSKLVDAFASAEAAVINRLVALKLDVKTMPGQNLATLAKAKPAPQYSKANKASVDAAIKELTELQALRCDIVHGKMQTVTVGGDDFAGFTNPQQYAPYSKQVRLISADQFAILIKHINQLASAIQPS
ncbi:MAG: hypothetical protein H6918_08710 [Sphingomonadaceae bacterium]|nr:hypothetical protein [Sphingomonadaceae bacterium]